MSDTKISALAATSPALATHRIPIAISPFGAGDNGYLTPAVLGTYIYSDTATLTNKTFGTAGFAVRNPANTFSYTIVGGAIAADRTITLPLLTAGDTLVAEGFTQTLSNKTIGGATGLRLNNPTDTFNYQILGGALAASRTVTFPAIGNNAVFTLWTSAPPSTAGAIPFTTATDTRLTSSANFTFTTGTNTLATGNLTLTDKLSVTTGSNKTAGTSVLVGGTVTVNTTAVTANSIILLTSQADGGTPGFVRITAKTAGTSFTITSSSGTDTSTIGWFFLN